MKHITGDLPEQIGVYSLRCSSGEYIGSSVNIRRRVYEHDLNLRSGKASRKLQSVADRGEVFQASVLVPLEHGCSLHDLRQAERQQILQRRPALNAAHSVGAVFDNAILKDSQRIL